MAIAPKMLPARQFVAPSREVPGFVGVNPKL